MSILPPVWMGRAHLFLLLLLPLHAPRSSFHPVPAAAVPVADGRGATRHPPLSRAGCAAAAGLPVGTLATSAGTLATPERTLVTPAGTLATPTTSRQPTPNSSATSAAPAAPDLRLRLVLIIRPTHPLADPLADAAGAERAAPAISCRSPAISCSCHGSGSAPGDVATTPSKSWVRARTNWPGGGRGGDGLYGLGVALAGGDGSSVAGGAVPPLGGVRGASPAGASPAGASPPACVRSFACRTPAAGRGGAFERSGSSAATRPMASGEATASGEASERTEGAGAFAGASAGASAAFECDPSSSASRRPDSHENCACSCACREAVERLKCIGVGPPRSRVRWVVGGFAVAASKSGCRRRGGGEAPLRSVAEDAVDGAPAEGILGASVVR